MSDIFLSYKSEDRPKAKIIAAALEQRGYSVWWDRIIPPGKTFDQVIEEALDAAKCVIVLWSGESVSSDWVKNEAREGTKRHILVPVLIEEVKIPFEFRHIQAAQLIDWQGALPNPEFDLLLQSVAEIVGSLMPKKEIKKPIINELEISAKQLYEDGRYSEAIDKWKEVLNLDPENRIAFEGINKVKWSTQEKEFKKKKRTTIKEANAQVREREEIAERKTKATSFKVFFAVVAVVGILALAYWVISPILTNSIKSTESNEKKFTNTIGMDFVQIPAGEFDMGSPWNEMGRLDDEGPVHHVKLAKTFYMGKYDVTQKQWRDIMGNNPSYFKGDDNLPVENISWNDVQEFIKKLNKKEDTDKYHLPSEAEWEYAARAGTTTRYYFGDDGSKLDDYAWYSANSNSETHPVGKKKPNPWGLYDMHGNVWEWVQDTYHISYDGAPMDGSSWENGSFNFASKNRVYPSEIDGSSWENGSAVYRVRRGSSYYHSALNLRSASRTYDDPSAHVGDVGFRLERDL